MSILESVKKVIRCGTKDMGFARYECMGCTEGKPEPVLICLRAKAVFVMDAHTLIQGFVCSIRNCMFTGATCCSL